MDKTAREQALRNWIVQRERSSLSDWQMISGDASFRRYFRYRDNNRSIIAVDAPPERENVHGFLVLGEQLRAQGLMTPTIMASDDSQGFWLLEDFGDTLLLNVLNDKTVHRYYTAAIDELIRFQRIEAITDYSLPSYDRERFSMELGLMPTWFLNSHLNYLCSADEHAMLQQTFELLLQQALVQPRVLTHRDFHSRNLMVLAQSPRLGLIDFQDSVWGPVSYDLVSLLKDCYIAWPRSVVLAMVEYYRRQAADLAALSSLDRETFIRQFDLMGLQRHIKVLGIFCRLYYRDGKAGYLADLPRVLDHAIDAAARYSETQAFADWLRSKIAPLLQRQNALVLHGNKVMN